MQNQVNHFIFFLFKIFDVLSEELNSSTRININTKWKQDGITIAGGNEKGNQLNQLYWPVGIFVDDDYQSIYIADSRNHRIVKWKYNENNGQLVAGGNGQGNRMDQLSSPTDVIFDKKNDSLIICDKENRRIVRWSRQNNKIGQILISDIDCSRLTMDNRGDIYVSNWKKNEVRRWKIGDTNGIIVAGGNGKGNQLNQLNYPTHIFVDKNFSIYVSDNENHRVMKWMKGAKEGIVVAGGQGEGSSLTQLSHPHGVIVDEMDNVYVADCENHRIMCWLKGSNEGFIVVGGNGDGKESNQLNLLRSISFDQEGNLYVADGYNNRVQKFLINLN
jgi:sugar lactone lactonase YvrE